MRVCAAVVTVKGSAHNSAVPLGAINTTSFCTHLASVYVKVLSVTFGANIDTNLLNK